MRGLIWRKGAYRVFLFNCFLPNKSKCQPTRKFWRLELFFYEIYFVIQHLKVLAKKQKKKPVWWLVLLSMAYKKVFFWQGGHSLFKRSSGCRWASWWEAESRAWKGGGARPRICGHFSSTLYLQVARHGGTVEQNVRPGITTIYVHTGMTLKGRLVAQRGQVRIFVSSGTS